MSFTKGGNANLSDEQVKDYILDLPSKRRIALMEALQLEGLKAKWRELLAAFTPNVMSDREIVRTCKEVRRELWEKRRNETTARRR
jgi:hypothetical protein